ncbi:MAG: YadA-like family protein [Sterolibacteriaceae bacterium]|nr:YadA-like family protein [Candidatus Methylophosphatis haderslevensis]
MTNAATAQATATTAFTTANNAQAAANTALTNSASAQSAASTALATAVTAESNARTYTDTRSRETLQQAMAYSDSRMQSVAADTLDRSRAYTDQQIAAISKRAYGGIAAAAALGFVVPAQPGGVSLNVGVGSYRGAGAMGIAIARTSSDSRVVVNGGVGVAAGGGVLMRAGAGYTF